MELERGIPDFADFDPLRVQREALHELGHVLDLGRATPLEQPTDIMAYGWALVDPRVVPLPSDCDLLGIRTAFGWYYNGEPPHASPVPEAPVNSAAGSHASARQPHSNTIRAFRGARHAL